MKSLFSICLIVILCGPVLSQNIGGTIDDTLSPAREANLPRVLFEIDNFYLSQAFYPDYRKSMDDPNRDVLLIQKKAAPLIAVWDTLGSRTLTLISSLSGAPWSEKSIRVYLMKYLPVPRLYEPLAIPVEGIRQNDKIEAVSSGWSLFFEFIQSLAGRNLLELRDSDSAPAMISDHPLLEPGPYRFDVMAITLAVACAEQIIPPDTLKMILTSDQWKRLNPGSEIYDDYLENKWPLSPEMPLISYIRSEPSNSSLVQLTAPPSSSPAEQSKKSSRGKPIPSTGKGRLGFSAVRGRGGYMDITSIDSRRLAYACGLRGGDRIQRVDGESVRNERELMTKILERLDAEGSFLTVLRDNKTKTILLRPMPPSEEN